MDKSIKAVECFNKGCNCAQSIVMVFKDEFDIKEEELMKISSGFGGGMGRLQDVCGTVTGAYMVIGMKKYSEEDSSKEEVYSLIREFTSKFKENNKEITCKGLLNCDLMTEEGKQYFVDNDLRNKVCVRCIEDSVNILQEML